VSRNIVPSGKGDVVPHTIFHRAMLLLLIPVEQQTHILDLFQEMLKAGLFHYLPFYKTVDAVLVFESFVAEWEKI
jgi:hypothetical protein